MGIETWASGETLICVDTDKGRRTEKRALKGLKAIKTVTGAKGEENSDVFLSQDVGGGHGAELY
jgi:hypothetical protein